jgi:hypothetical protein
MGVEAVPRLAGNVFGLFRQEYPEFGRQAGFDMVNVRDIDAFNDVALVTLGPE